MQQRKCIQCEKPLSADHVGDKCSLCAIGLLPSAPVDSGFDYQAQHIVEGRVLSGVICPQCYAELSLADLSARSCAICGGVFTHDRLQIMLRDARTRRDTPLPAPDASYSAHIWPEDAPLR